MAGKARPGPEEAPQSAAQRLEALLPLAEPATLQAHTRAALLEVGDPAQLLELAADSAIRHFLLCRLAPNVALVDAGQAGALAQLLRKRGHTPKVIS